jgi:FKBP-type peptidyl-prolyl cis-trans isomerase
MGRLVLATLAIIIVLGVRVRAEDPAPSPNKSGSNTPGQMPRIAAELKTKEQKGSYSLGYTVGKNLQRQFGSKSLDVAAFLLGMQESLSGSKASLEQAEREQAFQLFRLELQRKQEAAANEAAEMNKKKGEEFLAANKQKPGVTTLASGLQYLVMKEGAGKKPAATDNVKVHYHGTLLNGTVFDSSVDRKQPATFRLDQVIPGWTEVVQLMKEGSKYRVFIPPALAYRDRGTPGGPIGPNETLIFEIELLKVE